jgi:hypothetical protein
LIWEGRDVRQILSFIAASLLLFGGIYLVVFEAFEADAVRGVVLLAAGMMMAAGGAWLFDDFIRPVLRGKERQ